MLDTATKKRIDDCRDILVGKLPDPKAQIEQITIGLIYKFMDDMDKEAIELGGKSKFFSGAYKKYSWDNLFDTRVTATEMLRLYSEAIVSMDKNPNIPQLFRDIFKNAFLPYRDPETLKMFLRTISEFEYTHSEKLGDAFEYLLSVMGSQGDAGQFRTPRHIIDFLVAIVDPKKDDTILDPACGTAGFLISAFKHIREKNNDELTPAERKRLIQNFTGYDISPDMVRLSLVNLYLHGFSDPHIYEYDTLSSEERWKDNYDVILANPPFMSPKGGIRPHKKFSISSNRSEVLFVDYIAEHLHPHGRAGIIVPEGVIFQSGTAYKELRKMLVENYLYAVVSLPAGIFNPYSGVKTSILLMDREVAKKSKEILFVKIDNDGFNLGAQRNAIKGGQLEKAIKIIHDFNANGKHPSADMAHAVKKTVIAKSGDYNLSGERYKKQNLEGSDFILTTLEEIAEVKGGKRLPMGSTYSEIKTSFPYIRVVDFTENGIRLNDIKFITSDIQSQISNYTINSSDVYISIAGTIGSVGTIPDSLNGANLTENAAKLVIKNKSVIGNKYLALILRSESSKTQISAFTHAVGVPKLALTRIKKIQIPLPPLYVQEEIVAEIEGYQKIIDGAKMVVENYKPKIEIDPEWEMVELGELCSINGEIVKEIDMSFPYIGADSIQSNTGHLHKVETCEEQRVNGPVYKFSGKNILYSKIRPYLNKVTLVNFEGYCSSDMYPIITNKKLDLKYLFYFLLSEYFNNAIRGFYERASIPKINRKQLFSVDIPLPSVPVQRRIVVKIENEQALVEANLKLIEMFEQKIKDRIERVWGEACEIDVLNGKKKKSIILATNKD